MTDKYQPVPGVSDTIDCLRREIGEQKAEIEELKKSRSCDGVNCTRTGQVLDLADKVSILESHSKQQAEVIRIAREALEMHVGVHDQSMSFADKRRAKTKEALDKMNRGEKNK